MLTSFLIVGKQVVILFLLMAVGYLMGKTKLLSERGSVDLSTLVMYAASPAMLIVAFQRELIPSDLRDFGLTLSLSVLVHALSILLARLCIRSEDRHRRAALQLASVFSNSGFMGYPLMTAIVGTIGVFYGAAYNIVFSILVWTWGLRVMAGREGRLSLRPILLNPGTIGSLLALTLYLLRVSLPDLLLTPVTYLSHLNTPLPMLVVGYQFSRADLRSALRGLDTWIMAALRLVALPLIALGLCLLLGVSSNVGTSLVIAVATPPAMMVSMLAAKTGGDTAFSSSIVSTYTALSVLTIPLLAGLARFLLA